MRRSPIEILGMESGRPGKAAAARRINTKQAGSAHVVRLLEADTSVVSFVFQLDRPAVERVVEQLVELQGGVIGDAEPLGAGRIGTKGMAARSQHQPRRTRRTNPAGGDRRSRSLAHLQLR